MRQARTENGGITGAPPEPDAESQPAAAAPEQWPDVVDRRLAQMLADRHMIAFYEGQTRAVVSAFQQRRIGQLLQHAAKHSSWWRDRLNPLSKDGRLNFADLPLMTRADFRQSLDAAGGNALPLPAGHGRPHPFATSGSSGVPVRFHYSGLCGRMNSAHYLSDRVRHGVGACRPGGGGVIARYSLFQEVHPGPHVTRPADALLNRPGEFVRRAQQFTIEEHARWLRDVKPAYVVGHPTLLSGVMDVFERGAGGGPPPAVDRLLTYGETVTPEFRRRARGVLGARVLDRYSCHEIGPLAFQCPAGDDHYHVAVTNAVVEVLDDAGRPAGAGKVGRVFVTTLHNFASPMARYELGDLAALLPRCPCGHPHPAMTRLLGRERFLIRLPSGERRYINLGARHWLTVAPFTESRLVQTAPGTIRAECVLPRPLGADEQRALVELLKREIDPTLTYEVAQLDRIEWGPTYKRQDIVSLV